MQIKILGSGCKKCLTLADNTRLALEQQGQQANIEKVTDFAQIARGMGCHGVNVTTREQLAAALAEARGSGVPAVIDVTVDPIKAPGVFEFSGQAA